MLLKAAAGLFLAVTLQVGGCSLGSNGTQTVVLTSSSASPSGGSTTPPPSATPTATATAMPPAVYFAAYNPTTNTPGPYATLIPSQLDNELAAANLSDVSQTYQATNAGTIQNNGTTSPPDIKTTASFVNSSLVVGFIEGTSNGFTLESRRSGTTYISTTFSSTGGTWSDTNGAGQTFTPYTFATPLTAGTQYYAKWDTATSGSTTPLTLTIYTPSGTIVDQETATDTVSASQGLSGPDYVNETADTSDTAGITSIQAYNGVQTAAAVANPATPIPAVTPAPGATQGAVYMLGADFACGTTPRGSVAYPTAAPSPLNTNAAATFNGHVPLIVVLTEVPGAGSSSAYSQPACPSSWLGVQYMIRFDSYADYLAQKGIIPSWVYWVQYDNEPGVSPTTAPSELPSPNGNPTNIPAQFYGQFSQLAGTGTNGAGAGTPAPQYFQSSGQWANLTSGEKVALKSTSAAYGTYGGYGWLSLYLQSQNAGATVSNWVTNWNNELSAVVPINPNILTFVGVGQVLTGPYFSTQAQMENVIEARPPNITGIYLNCSAVSPVPIGYAECAQALADTAGVTTNPSPSPFPSLSPLPFPTGSPSTPVPSATPTATMTPTPPPSPAAAVATTAPFHFASGTQHTITFGAPTATTFNVGDLLIYSPTYGSGNGPGSAPAGWTEVSGCSGNSNGGIANDVFTHVITSGDAGDYTWAGISGVSSGILFDVTNATFVTAAQTTGTASSTGVLTGQTVTAGALDETIAFFGVLGGTTANNISPRTATSPFTSPVVTQAAASNATFAMSSGASGSLTPAGTLGGSPNPYYTGAYVECTVVAHVPSDPTPSPSPTAAIAIATPWSYNNGSTTPRPFTLPGASTSVTVIASYLGSANPLGGTIATLLNSWALESGKTDGSATTGAAVDAHSYDAGNTSSLYQAVPTNNLTAGTTYTLALVQNGAVIKFEECPSPSYTCAVTSFADANPLAIGSNGYVGAFGSGVRVVQGDIWNFQVYNVALTDAQIQTIASGTTADPYPTPTPSMSPPPSTPTPSSESALLCVHFASNPMCDQIPSSPAISSNSSAWSALEFQSGEASFGQIQVSTQTGSALFNDSYDDSYPFEAEPVGSSEITKTFNCQNPFGAGCSISTGTTLHIPSDIIPEGASDHHFSYDDYANQREVDFWDVISAPPYSSGGNFTSGGGGFCAWGTDGTGCSDSTATEIATALTGGIDPIMIQAAEADSVHGVLPYALGVTVVCADPSWVYPATYSDGGNTNSNPQCSGHTNSGQRPPEGTRWYLNMTDAQVNSTSNVPWVKVILRTIDKQHMGGIITDTNYSGTSAGMQFTFRRGDYSEQAQESGVNPNGGDYGLSITNNGINLPTQIIYCSNGTC